MDEKDARVVPPADVPLVRRPHGVFVSYAHESEGRKLAAAIIPALRAQGCDVVSDHDLALQNPTSVPAWIDDQIANRVVLCLLTPGYLHAFEEVAEEGTAKRKGVRYELRAIRQRIYDHEGRDDCPIIPVASPELPIDLVPATLRGLDISRFNPEDSSGTNKLVERIAKLEGTGGIGAMSTKERVPPDGGMHRFRQVVYKLEDDLPAEQAIALARECLHLAEDPDLSAELVPAFPQLAEVIKDHGQISIMRVLTDRCLHVLRSSAPLLRWEHLLEARLLICGTAWYLQRDHRLQDALDNANAGMALAERFGDRRITAYGRQCVGRIQRLLAEDANDEDIDHYLKLSYQSLDEATALFTAVDGDWPPRSEVGSCLSLRARTLLTRYHRLNDRPALAHADKLAQEASRVMTANQKKDQYDLKILRAEIAAANRKYSEGRKLLGNVIESLIAEVGALYSEILARAYVARANLAVASRSAKSEIVSDLRKARTIFEQQELSHATAACTWTMLTIDPRSVTSVKVTRTDIQQLKDLAVDPRTRLDAIAKLEQQSDVHLPQRIADWAALVERTR
jgi:hypothetical protein